MSDATPNPTGPPAADNGDDVATFTVGAGFDWADPNSPLAKYYFGVSHVLAVFFVGFVFVVAAYFPLWHTDVWGHLKYGKWMVENRAIPDREPFSPWWDGRQSFTQFYTLTQLAMYGAYAAGDRLAGPAGGVEMLRVEHALLTAARIAVMLFAFVRLGRSWPLALLGGVVVVLLDLSNLAVFRPQVFAQLFFAVLLLPLSRDVLCRRALVLVPLLIAAWANSHGSFIVALTLLGLLAA